MSSVNITYLIRLSNTKEERFEFELLEDSFDLIGEEIKDPPKWTKLEYQQCPHCPLKAEEHEFCPLALRLYDVVERFHETKSIDEVEMEVITEERRVIQKTDLQRALASMLDLIFPICGCPITEHMKPMSRFHLPLASEEETVFRVTGMYLLAQYFLRTEKQGGLIGFNGLIQIYEDLHKLNVAVAKRLKIATRSDSSKNAITLLDMYSTLVPMLLEDELSEMKTFFRAYLSEEEVIEADTGLFEKFKELSFGLIDIEDERPLWLKQLDPDYVFPEDRVEDKEEVKTKVEETEADRILKNATFSLELEPINAQAQVEEKKRANFGTTKEIDEKAEEISKRQIELFEAEREKEKLQREQKEKEQREKAKNKPPAEEPKNVVPKISENLKLEPIDEPKKNDDQEPSD